MNTSVSYCAFGVTQYFTRVLEELWLTDACDGYLERIDGFNDLNSETIAVFAEEEAMRNQYAAQIRSAIQHWASFTKEDRQIILQTYRRLFHRQLEHLTSEQITLVFCRIFLEEFVPHLCGLAAANSADMFSAG